MNPRSFSVPWTFVGERLIGGENQVIRGPKSGAASPGPARIQITTTRVGGLIPGEHYNGSEDRPRAEELYGMRQVYPNFGFLSTWAQR